MAVSISSLSSVFATGASFLTVRVPILAVFVVALMYTIPTFAQSGERSDAPAAMASTGETVSADADPAADAAHLTVEEAQRFVASVRTDLNEEQQYSVLRATMQEHLDANAFSPLVADAYLTLLTPDRLEADRDLAHQTYIRLIETLGSATSEPEQQVERRHAAQIVPLLSAADARQVLRGDPDDRVEKWAFREGAGDVLATWWRRSDPMPATPHNERLSEHMQRVAVATETYSCDERASGFDDRGMVFVRYGAPGRTDEIEYNSMNFQLDVFRFGVPVTQRDFPDNELWSYPEIDDASYFIFTENARRCYDLGGASDLVPSRLFQGRGRSERAENIAYSGMMALRYVYNELSLFHIDFSATYSEIENYVLFQENAAIEAEVENVFGIKAGSGGMQTTTVGAGLNQTRTIASSPNFGITTPAGFVTPIAMQIEQEDRAAAYRRKQNTPRQVTDLITSEEVMPVAVQLSRFLNPDGTTRVEVAWGVQKLHLRPLDEDAEAKPSLLTFDAVQFDADYRRLDQMEQRYAIEPSALVGDDLFVSPPVVFETTRDISHFGLQWTQFDIDNDASGEPVMGERMRIATSRTDSLLTLHAAGERLEMSDVRYMIAPSGTVDDAVSFPFSTFSPDTPLVLYFELYHLAYGADDQTTYTVAYDVERRDRQGWRRLFGTGDTEKTTTEVTYSGTQRRAEEFISIDLSTLRQPKTQDLRVTVRVTDDVTGETVARAQRIKLVGTEEL